MLDLLPAELAIPIVEHAAHALRFSDRRSVMHLASTSRTIYAIVSPILYHTLLVDAPRAVRIQAFMFDQEASALATRVFSFVRVLVWSIGARGKIDPLLFTSLECVHGLGGLIVEVAKPAPILRFLVSDHSLRRVHFHSIAFSKLISKLPVHSSAFLTHVSGLLPLIHSDSDWRGLYRDPAVWTHAILDHLPALTHLGLALINIGPLYDHGAAVERFDLEALEAVLLIALAHANGKLARVALRVGGRYIGQRRGDLEELEKRVQNPRFGMWWDDRPMDSWDNWNEWMNQDAMAGRDIWTEAQYAVH